MWLWRTELTRCKVMGVTGGSGVPLHAALGAGVKAMRSARDLRLEDVSAAARAYGLTWGPSSVAQLEVGKRRLTVEEYALLPTIMAWAGWLAGRTEHVESVTIEQLLPDPQLLVRLSPERAVPAAAAIAMLRGADVHEAAPAPGSQQIGGLLTRKARERLGLEPARLSELCELLWGEGATAESERDRLASESNPNAAPRQRQALRAHAARQVLAALSAAEQVASATPWPRSGNKVDRWHGWRERVRERLAAEGLVRERER
jgi:hypothetical protein